MTTVVKHGRQQPTAVEAAGTPGTVCVCAGAVKAGTAGCLCVVTLCGTAWEGAVVAWQAATPGYCMQLPGNEIANVCVCQ